MTTLGLELTPKGHHSRPTSSETGRPGLARIDTNSLLEYYQSTEATTRGAHTPRHKGERRDESPTPNRRAGNSSASLVDSAEATPTSSTFQRDSRIHGQREHSSDARYITSERPSAHAASGGHSHSHSRTDQHSSHHSGAERVSYSVPLKEASFEVPTRNGHPSKPIRRQRSRTITDRDSDHAGTQSSHESSRQPRPTYTHSSSSSHSISSMSVPPTPQLSTPDSISPSTTAPSSPDKPYPKSDGEVFKLRHSSSKSEDHSRAATVVQPKLQGMPFAPGPAAMHFNGSFLFYDPVSHSSAGPPPPPSTGAPAPPRPPRRSPSMKSNSVEPSPSLPSSQTLLPALPSLPPISRNHSEYSVMAVSVSSKESEGSNNSRSASTEAVNLIDRDRDRTPAATIRAAHTREGAFPAKSIFLTHPAKLSTSSPVQPIVTQVNVVADPPLPSPSSVMDQLVADVGSAIDDLGGMYSDGKRHAPPSPMPVALPPPEVVEPEVMVPSGLVRRRSGIDIHRDKMSNISRAPSELPHEQALEIPGHLSQRESPSSPRSASPLKRSGTLTLDERAYDSSPAFPKRSLSVVRSLSMRSLSRVSSQRTLSRSTSGASSPSLPGLPAAHPRRKLPPGGAWPDAMKFNDVINRKSTLERGMGYAKKINELAACQSALGEWTSSLRQRSTNPTRDTLTPLTSPTATTSKQQRRISRGSMTSEVTFPLRADSYTATNLTVQTIDNPAAPSPTLPYPLLAQGIGLRTSPSKVSFNSLSSSSTTSPTKGLTSLASSSSLSPAGKLAGGFFATIGTTIGRRGSASTKRPTLPQLGKAVASRPVVSASASASVDEKPVSEMKAPTIVGGPRAAPTRTMTRPRPTPTPTPAPSQQSSHPHPHLHPHPNPQPQTKTQAQALLSTQDMALQTLQFQQQSAGRNNAKGPRPIALSPPGTASTPSTASSHGHGPLLPPRSATTAGTQSQSSAKGPRPNSFTSPATASSTSGHGHGHNQSHAPPPLHPRSAPPNRSSWSPRTSADTPSNSDSNTSTTDPGFAEKLEKLSDVLPDVDPSILAAYLRKTGSHLSAINAYLEDKRTHRVIRI